MHHCINCGRPAATRQGDTFTCERCKFTWDVAFEQANRAYLRAQGREPARPMAEEQAEATAGAPGLAALEDLATPVKFDTLSNVEELPGTALPEFDPETEREATPFYEVDDLEELSRSELKALAVERGIALTGRDSKAEIIAALRDAEA